MNNQSLFSLTSCRRTKAGFGNPNPQTTPGSDLLKAEIQISPIKRLIPAAINAVSKTPKNPIRKYPAKRQPAAAPSVLIEYK